MQVTITIPTPVSILRQWKWSLLAALVVAIPLVGGGIGSAGGPGPFPATITNDGQYPLPKSCFEVRDSVQTPLFEVCDNDFAGPPASDAVCANDGICDDEASAGGTVTVTLVPGDYRVVETSVAPNHAPDISKEICDASVGPCTVSFSSVPNTRPWHPWDITGAGGLPDGFVRVDDILQVVNHYFQDKPLP